MLTQTGKGTFLLPLPVGATAKREREIHCKDQLVLITNVDEVILFGLQKKDYSNPSHRQEILSRNLSCLSEELPTVPATKMERIP